MNKQQFFHVLDMAIQWEAASDERIRYPEFETPEETQLFDFITDMFHNQETMDKLGMLASVNFRESNPKTEWEAI